MPLVRIPSYLGIERTPPEAFIIDITLNAGRSTELEQRFYTEVTKDNWSFGNGIAQYVPEG